RVPIIMLTAQGDKALDLDAMKSGAADYLFKVEFAPKLLERAIRYAHERHHAREALRESEERFALAVRGANDGVWDWNLRTGEVYFSTRWKAILGYEDKDISRAADEWLSRVHADDVERVKAG